MAKESKEEITVVVSSRKSPEEGAAYVEEIKNTVGCPAKILFITNNGSVGLCELYGGILENKNIESDIIIFAHDDLEYLRPGWGSEIKRLFKENPAYGIIGVAGSAEFGDRNSYGKAMWWNYKKRYGQVLHKANGKSWLTCFSDLLDHDLEEVCVIDGLFMAFNKKKIKKNFDKSIKHFDGYDIDTCLANYLEGVKIGVTTNIRLAHKSIGQMSEHWAPNMEYICEKFKDYLPIDMPKPKDKRFKK